MLKTLRRWYRVVRMLSRALLLKGSIVHGGHWQCSGTLPAELFYDEILLLVFPREFPFRGVGGERGIDR